MNSYFQSVLILIFLSSSLWAPMIYGQGENDSQGDVHAGAPAVPIVAPVAAPVNRLSTPLHPRSPKAFRDERVARYAAAYRAKHEADNVARRKAGHKLFAKPVLGPSPAQAARDAVPIPPRTAEEALAAVHGAAAYKNDAPIIRDEVVKRVVKAARANIKVRSESGVIAPAVPAFAAAAARADARRAAVKRAAARKAAALDYDHPLRARVDHVQNLSAAADAKGASDLTGPLDHSEIVLDKELALNLANDHLKVAEAAQNVASEADRLAKEAPKPSQRAQNKVIAETHRKLATYHVAAALALRAPHIPKK